MLFFICSLSFLSYKMCIPQNLLLPAIEPEGILWFSLYLKLNMRSQNDILSRSCGEEEVLSICSELFA